MMKAEVRPSDQPSPKWISAALVAMAVGAWLLRASPLLRSGGPLAHPIDFDEGVYFSAAALALKGILPYRDFVFVHPPGLLYALTFTAGWVEQVGTATAFAAARFVAVSVGALNVFLVGRIASRGGGLAAGLAAAGLYAGYPEVLVVERGPFLESVLNLACLSTALWCLGARKPWHTLVAGSLCGMAIAIKLWGGLWLVAAVLTVFGATRLREALRFIGAAALAFLVLVFPLALQAPSAFITDVLLFHAWRPGDGEMDRLTRLLQILGGPHGLVSVLAIAGLILGLLQRDLRTHRAWRFFATVYVLTVVAFMLPAAYWPQYNSHLAASESVMAGFGITALLRLIQSWRPSLRVPEVVMVALALALSAPQIIRAISVRPARAPEQVELGQALVRLLQPDDCVFAFEPAWGLMGGRLPQMVDTYGSLLLAAVKDGTRYPNVDAAFHSSAAQAQMRAAIEGCRFVAVGWRGRWQLTQKTQAWLREHYVQRHPDDGAAGIELWERVR